MTVYIASRDEKGGILRCELSGNGQLEERELTRADRPAYLCRDGDRLYALLREPFQLMSGLNTYMINDDAALSMLGDTRSTHGLYSAHLFAEAGKVWIANYIDGTVALLREEAGGEAFPDRMLAFSGHGPDQSRQLSSHPHCVVPTPDGKYLCICDLGTDRVHVITPLLEPVSECLLPAGCGSRHLVFTPDGGYAFCSNEMGTSVSAMSYHDGVLSAVRTVPALSEHTEGTSSSGIRISKDGKKLFVSNRGSDSVSFFSVEGSELCLTDTIPAFGTSPREIALTDDFLLCANELSDSVTVIPLHDKRPGTPVCTLHVKTPWCILVLE